mmetsp:Transcript_7753/g.7000  ORF Transcript_7753/g.7000 Transcript_7753/m.7000 type:complete len:94 (+) Transcript_7753:584-865(+)
MLERFKEELRRSGQRLRGLEAENKVLRTKCDKIDTATLDIFTLNQEVKQELENSKKEKEKVRVKCKKLQDQTVSLDKEIKALQEAGKAQEASQ